jgi:hypothetical protein
MTKVIRILPEGIFEIIWMKKRGIQNCKLCWFGQTNNGIHHCPNNIRCSFDDGTAIIFKKVGENTMNDKKKPEPVEMDGIIKRITGAIESIMKRQDTLSERITAIEHKLEEIATNISQR